MRMTENDLGPDKSLSPVAQDVIEGRISGSNSGLISSKDSSFSSLLLSCLSRKSGPVSHMLDIKALAGIDLEATSAGFKSLGTLFYCSGREDFLIL